MALHPHPGSHSELVHFVQALEDLTIEINDAACGEPQLPGECLDQELLPLSHYVSELTM